MDPADYAIVTTDVLVDGEWQTVYVDVRDSAMGVSKIDFHRGRYGGPFMLNYSTTEMTESMLWDALPEKVAEEVLNRWFVAPRLHPLLAVLRLGLDEVYQTGLSVKDDAASDQQTRDEAAALAAAAELLLTATGGPVQ